MSANPYFIAGLVLLAIAAIAFRLSRKPRSSVRALDDIDPLLTQADRLARRQTMNLAADEAVASDAIEPGIAPLVNALNRVTGVVTMASCQAHQVRRPLLGGHAVIGRPYVLFSSDLQFPRMLDAWLAQGLGPNARTLHYTWRLMGYFHPDAPVLAWTIEVVDNRLPGQFDRLAADADVMELAEAVDAIHAQLQRQRSVSAPIRHTVRP
jgi:hypothetical protein